MRWRGRNGRPTAIHASTVRRLRRHPTKAKITVAVRASKPTPAVLTLGARSAPRRAFQCRARCGGARDRADRGGRCRTSARARGSRRLQSRHRRLQDIHSLLYRPSLHSLRHFRRPGPALRGVQSKHHQQERSSHCQHDLPRRQSTVHISSLLPGLHDRALAGEPDHGRYQRRPERRR